MRRSFTIAALLAVTLAAGTQAQTNQSGSGSKTLVELEAQAKAKKKATASDQSGAQTSDQTAAGQGSGQTSDQAGDGSGAASGAATTKSSTVKKSATTSKSKAPTTRTARRTIVRRSPSTATASAKPATTPAGATGQGPNAGPAPLVAQPAQQPAQQPVDPADRKIYKAGDIPDEWKFKKEKDRDTKKPVTEEGAGAASAPAVSVAPVASEASGAPGESRAETAGAVAVPVTAALAASAGEASVAGEAAPSAPAAPASASQKGSSVSSVPASSVPAATAQTSAPAPSSQAPSSAPDSQKTAGTPPQKTPTSEQKPHAAPEPTRSAAKSSTTGSQGWRDRGYISGNFGWQATSTTFTDARTLSSPTGDSEPRHMTASYDVKAGPMFDIGAGFRLVKNLGVGVAVTRFSGSNDIKIDATVPHPFFFNAPRPVSGTTPGTREELAVHVDAVWVVPGKKLQVAIFGGPTFFNAKQTVVSDFRFNDVYPFDNPPTFTAAVSTDESKSVVGFNAGVDVGYFFTDVFGVGGLLRFSRGTFASSIGDLDLGGPEFAGGVRIRLRRSAPSSKTPPPVKAPPPVKKK